MTLRARLTLAFVLVVLVPLLVGAALVARAFPAAVSTRQQSSVATGARLVSQVLRDYCDRARTTAEAAGREASTESRSVAKVGTASLVQRGLADGVRVMGSDGSLVASAGDVPANAVDCLSGASDGVHLTAVVPLQTAGGQGVGSAVASFDLQGEILSRLQSAMGDSQLALLSSPSTVVLHTGTIPLAVLAAALRHAEGFRTDGWVVAAQPADGGQPFAVVVGQRLGQGPGLLVSASVVVLVSVLAAGCIAVLSARATTRPLEALTQAATRVASGDLSTLIEVRSRDEVGHLAMSFNAMTEDLRTYVGQLEASRDELQNGLARLGDTLASSHDLDRILHVVLESAMASVRASGGMVLLINGGRLDLAASQGADAPVDLRVAVGEGISGVVAKTGESLLGRIGHGPGELWPAPGEPTGTTCIAVPLKSSGAVLGVLVLFGSELPGGFDQADLATIRAFANQATVAVDNVLLHQEAQRLSITDALTGLWNYRYFTMAIGREIERASRFHRPLALLMLDLDHFKDVNDSFGHQRGDAVLIELAKRVHAEARDVDTVARYGGEELVVILPETDRAGAAQAAERICAAIRRKPFGEPSAPAIQVTVSAGVAVYPEHGTSASQLLARADAALYEAKHAGRDTWRVSDGSTAG